MKKYMLRYILSAVVAVAAVGADAVVIDATPGSLASQVTPDETSLTVTGSIDARDFDAIRSLRKLTTLDLSGVTVAPYHGPMLESGVMESGAGELPFGALMSVPATTVTLPRDITTISAGALGNMAVKELVIPPTVTSIATGALSSLPALEKITVPASVTAMGEKVFKDCPRLAEADIQGAITELPGYTFQNCPSLSKVTLPSTLKSIGRSAFAGCTSLGSITLPQALTAIDELAFAGSGLTEINMSDNSRLSRIGDWAFAGCHDLKDVVIGSEVKSLGRGAFANNSQLSSQIAVLAGKATSLPAYFVYGSTLTSAEGLDHLSIDSIGDYALSGNLATDVKLPGTVTHLGSGAMERMPNLDTLDLTSIYAVPTLGTDVWAATDQPGAVCYVRRSLLKEYQNTPQWKEFDLRLNSESSVDEVEISDEISPVRGIFDGMALHLECDTDIRQAQLYDVSGRVLTIRRDAPSRRLTIDTAPFDTRVFLVRLLLADGRTPVLKLVRK